MAVGWILVVLIALYLYTRYTKIKQLPPGPFPLPLIGNYVQMTLAHMKGLSLVEWYEQCKKVYGPVFTVWLGPMPIVMVCDFDNILEVYVNNADSTAQAGRQKAWIVTAYRGHKGLVWTDGPEWQEQRRFSLRVLKDFGFGRNLMQQRIFEEITLLFEKLDDDISVVPSGRLVLDPGPCLDLLIGSVINKILVGYRYDSTNEDELKKLKGGLDKQLEVFLPSDMVIYNKYTYKLPFLKQRYDTVAAPQVEVINHFRELIQKRKDEIASGKHVVDPTDPNDYLDAYLAEIGTREKSGEDMGFFSESFLAANLLDLYVAGMETTILALRWGLLFILNSPEVQDRLREEVFKNTGGNRFVEIGDKFNMEYARAVVTEVLRCANIMNFNLLHETTNETNVAGYVIPRGTVTTPQISVAMRDSQVFDRPLEFDPDRFLGENGKELEKKVVAFGLGRRSCLGESLARAEIFLFLTNFVQRYKFSSVDGKPVDTEPISDITNMHRVKPYQMTLEKLKA
uniref:CYtochrome P450 family n=1 Tax=Steinernema glaseri TaxID=37863 RepID=A0A1I7Z7N1_9BILA